MTRRRLIAAVVLTAGVVLGPMVSLSVAVVWQSLFPATVSWDSHGAYVKCEGAIKDPSQWPKEKAAKCRAMRMCESEAVLGETERRVLEANEKKQGCD